MLARTHAPGGEAPADVPEPTAAAWLDRIEGYARWGGAERAGKRLLAPGDALTALRAEAQRRGYAIIEPRNSVDTAGGSVDICVLGRAIADAHDPLHSLGAAWTQLSPGGVVSVFAPPLEPRGAAPPTFGFDHATLESALARAGFEHIRIATARDGGFTAAARRGAAPPIDTRRGRLSIVMPVFNEKRTFNDIVALVLAKEIPGLDLEIVIVESRSTDGTRDDVARVAGHPRVTVVWQEQPRGKGHAVRAGLAVATGDFVLIQDADLEYDVDDYDMLLAPLRQFQRAFVLGVRHGKGGHTWKVRHFTDRALLGKWMNFGHLIFTTLFNVVYGQRLTDPFTMYKVFRRECLSGLRLEANAFDFDWELAGKLVRCGYPPLELPVSYTSRSFSEGKKVTMIRDPLTWIRACFKYRFAPLKGDAIPPDAR